MSKYITLHSALAVSLLALLLILVPTTATATIFKIDIDFESDNFSDLQGDNTVAPVLSLGGAITFHLDNSLAVGTLHNFTADAVSIDDIGDSHFDTSNTAGLYLLNNDQSIAQIHFFGRIDPGPALGGSDDFVLSTFRNTGIDRFRYTIDEDANAQFWDFQTSLTLTVTPVPGPASIFLMVGALGGMLFGRCLNSKRRAAGFSLCA